MYQLQLFLLFFSNLYQILFLLSANLTYNILHMVKYFVLVMLLVGLVVADKHAATSNIGGFHQVEGESL